MAMKVLGRDAATSEWRSLATGQSLTAESRTAEAGELEFADLGGQSMHSTHSPESAVEPAEKPLRARDGTLLSYSAYQESEQRARMGSIARTFHESWLNVKLQEHD